MQPPPVVTLLSATIPPRAQRTLRRTLADLGAHVHVATAKTDALPPGTTHLLLSTPLPQPALALAIASASTVRLITPAFVQAAEKAGSLTPPPAADHVPVVNSDPTVLLPASPDTLWLGRIWSGAHAFWALRPPALTGLRVLVVGQLRPRGPAGMAAPSSRAVTHLLSAAGADLAATPSALVSFAVVAPGLSATNNADVRALLELDVLCLASAFVVDLLVRVDANPVQYAMFDKQRALCGPALNVQSIPSLPTPLPIMRRPASAAPAPPSVTSSMVTPEKTRRVLCKLPVAPQSTAVPARPLPSPAASAAPRVMAVPVPSLPAPTVLAAPQATAVPAPSLPTPTVPAASQTTNVPVPLLSLPTSSTTPSVLPSSPATHLPAAVPPLPGSSVPLPTPVVVQPFPSVSASAPASGSKITPPLPDVSSSAPASTSTTVPPPSGLATTAAKSTSVIKPLPLGSSAPATVLVPCSTPAQSPQPITASVAPKSVISTPSIAVEASHPASGASAPPSSSQAQSTTPIEDQHIDAAAKPTKLPSKRRASATRRKRAPPSHPAPKSLRPKRVSIPSAKLAAAQAAASAGSTTSPVTPAKDRKRRTPTRKKAPPSSPATPALDRTTVTAVTTEPIVRPDEPVDPPKAPSPTAPSPITPAQAAESSSLSRKESRLFSQSSGDAPSSKKTHKRLLRLSPSSDSEEENAPQASKPALSTDLMPSIPNTQSTPKDVCPPRAESPSSDELESSQIKRKRPRSVRKSQPPIIDLNSGSDEGIAPEKPCTKLTFNDDDDVVIVDCKAKQAVSTKPPAVRMETHSSSSRRKAPVYDGTSSRQRVSQQRKRARSTSDSESDDNTSLGFGLLSESRSGALDGDDLSVEEGFDFVVGCIGGEPSVSEMNKLLRRIGAPVKEEEKEKEPSVECLPESPNAGFEESPVFLDDPDPVIVAPEDSCAFYSRHDHMDDPFTNNLTSTMNASQRARRSSREDVTRGVLVQIPTQPVVIKNVIPSELVSPKDAHFVQFAPGNFDDDRSCQESVSCTEWLLGAEKLVGYLLQDADSDDSLAISSSCRRSWRAFFESKVVDGLGSARTLNDAQFGIVVGYCIRTMLLNFQLDMSGVLLRELLSIREKQKEKGIDSLETVLITSPSDLTPFRDKAVSALWALLFKVIADNYTSTDPWEYFNGALFPLIDDTFTKEKFKDQRYIKSFDKRLTTLVETLTVIAAASSFRLDSLTDETECAIIDPNELIQPNWAVVCKTLDAFSGSIASFNGYENAKALLLTLLKSILLNFCDGLWHLKDTLVNSVIEAICSVSSLGSGSCFCVKTPHVPTWNEGLTGEARCESKIDVKVVVNQLKTPCEFILYLGSVYAKTGPGNSMKKAMSVIRNSSKLTSDQQSLQAVNHYIGLLLSVADCIASASEDGEFLFCQMLTSRSPSLSSLPETGDVDGAKIEHCLQAMLDAVRSRCASLVSTKGSVAVQVYTNWLCETTIETIMMIRKCADRRTATSVPREVLRVHETIVTKAATQLLRTIAVVIEHVTGEMSHFNEESWSVILNVVDGFRKRIGGLCTFCGEIEIQLRQNSEEALSKNRDVLLIDMLDAIEAMTKIAVRAFMECLHRASANGDVIHTGNLRERALVSARAYTAIFNDDMDVMLMNVVDSASRMRDQANAAKARSKATGIISVAFGLHVISEMPGWTGDNCSVLLSALRNKRFDILWWDRIRSVGIGRNGVDASTDMMDEATMLNFWWQAFTSRWVLNVLPKAPEIEGIVLSAFLWLLLSDTEVWSEDTRSKMHSIANELRKIPGLSDLTIWEEVTGSRRDLRSALPVDNRAGVAQALLCHAAQAWTLDKTRALVAQLRTRTQGTISTRKNRMLCDGLRLYGELFVSEARARGFSGGAEARWMSNWLGDLGKGVHRLRAGGGGAREGRETLDAVQRATMGGLCVVNCDGRAMEVRVAVLRVVRALGDADDLAALWEMSTADGVRGGEDGRRRARRNLEDWQGYLFRSVVEDALLRGLRAGRPGAVVMRRLSSAARVAAREEGESGVKCMVRAVVGKVVAQGLHRLVEADLASWQLWRQTCEAVGHDVSN